MTTIAELHAEIYGKTPQEIAKDTPKYAFTEFITFKFRQGVQLEDDSTTEGRIWANTVKTYLEQDDVGAVWWGRTVEERDTVILVVDWETKSSHQAFRQSPTNNELEAALMQIMLTSSTSNCFLLPRYFGTRRNALSSLFRGPSYTAIYTWAVTPFVPPPLISALGPADTQTRAWEYCWFMFAMEAMRSEKGISVTQAEGWEAGDSGNSEEHETRKGFRGLLRWEDVDGHRAYLDTLTNDPRPEGKQNDRIDTLMTGMELCHVQFTSLEKGWLGSVTKEWPDVKYPNGLFKQDCG